MLFLIYLVSILISFIYSFKLLKAKSVFASFFIFSQILYSFPLLVLSYFRKDLASIFIFNIDPNIFNSSYPIFFYMITAQIAVICAVFFSEKFLKNKYFTLPLIKGFNLRKGGLIISYIIISIAILGLLIYWPSIGYRSLMDFSIPLVFSRCIRFCPTLAVLTLQSCIYRFKNNINYKSDKYIFIFSFLVCIIYLFKSKYSSDIVSFSLGISALLILNNIKFYLFQNIRKLFLEGKINFTNLIFIISPFLGIVTIYFVRGSRENNFREDYGILNYIYYSDFAVPIVNLYLSIYSNLIIPIEVIKSNFGNILTGQYPLLQSVISSYTNFDKFLLDERSNTRAYYLITEGFNFLGFSGFIYIFITLLFYLSLWKIISKCDSYISLPNCFVALQAMQVFNLMRSQSIYFIRFLYFYILPGVFIYYLLNKNRKII